MKTNNTTLTSLLGAGFLLAGQLAMAEDGEPVKLGLMLPYTGTYTALGEAITNGLKLAIEQNSGQLGGREVEYVQLDSEANPSKAPQNMSRLVNSDEVDVVIGPGYWPCPLRCGHGDAPRGQANRRYYHYSQCWFGGSNERTLHAQCISYFT